LKPLFKPLFNPSEPVGLLFESRFNFKQASGYSNSVPIRSSRRVFTPRSDSSKQPGLQACGKQA
jgi:hypothetical protein